MLFVWRKERTALRLWKLQPLRGACVSADVVQQVPDTEQFPKGGSQDSDAMKFGQLHPLNESGDLPRWGVLCFAARCSSFVTTVGDTVDCSCRKEAGVEGKNP